MKCVMFLILNLFFLMTTSLAYGQVSEFEVVQTFSNADEVQQEVMSLEKDGYDSQKIQVFLLKSSVNAFSIYIATYLVVEGFKRCQLLIRHNF